MLKNFLQKLVSFGSRSQIDPSQFGDPVAIATQWTPAKSGGANFRTHKLIEVDTTRIEFQASTGAKIFYGVFMVFGLGFSIVFSALQFSNENASFEFEMFIPIFFGLIFLAVGALMFYFGTAPVVFDKAVGYFWAGRKSPQEVFDVRTVKRSAELSQIHALQLISEYVRGNKSSYYSYELNLVLSDGKRLNVVDHGNLDKLRQDAKTLSAFLGKPIWDAT